MDTKDLIGIKKERIREELEKLVPPGFNLQPHPKNRTRIYDEIDKFLGIDETLAREVGYLVATNKGYDLAIQNLRFFGVKLRDYKEVKNTGPFHKDAELNRNLEESCDYLIRFYDLSEITIKRINDEEDVRLKLLQNQQEKEKKALEQSEEKKQKAKSFVSSATQFRPGGKVKIKVTKPTGIIPKRAVPQQVLETISKKTTEQEEDQNITGSKKLVSDLGRVTLQIEQTNNNLNRVIEVIAEDIANVKEQNRKEVDEYRKRVQDRGKKLGARQLGSSKVDVAGVVQKYVGSFFSGTGGAIRALASFNLLQKLLEGDFVGAIGPLLGIGATYLPQIGAFVAGLIGKKILKGMFGGGGRQTARAATRVTQSGGTKVPKLGKFGRLGLLAGGLSLGGALLAGRGGDEDGTEQEQRLEQLTQEQKGLVEPEDIKSTAIPQSELKRFQSLNEKFDKTLDFLLKKQQEQEKELESRENDQPGAPRARNIPAVDLENLNVEPGSISSLADFKKVLAGTPMESESEEIYNTALREGINPAFVAGLSGAESSFGSRGIAVGTKNPFGILHQGFNPKTYAEAVEYLARHLRNPSGPYSGKRTLPDVMNTYSPPSENDTESHIRNIQRIGGRTGGDPNAIFIPRNTSPPNTPSPPPPKTRKLGEGSNVPSPLFVPIPLGQGTQPRSLGSAADGSSNPIAVPTDENSACGFMAKLNKLSCQLSD